MFTGIYYPAKDKFKAPVIIMEKMQFSLTNVVEKHNNLQLNKIIIILNDVCSGLQYLHSRDPPIIHRDLTPNNILLCSHLRAKITDLGLARTLETTNATLTQNPGMVDFMAPECFTDKPVYGLPLDIFSFGGVILYVTTQKWPRPAPWISFDKTNKRIVLTELQRRQQYLDKMTGTNVSLKDLTMFCLHDNPTDRPTAKEILNEIKIIKKASEKFGAYCDIWADIPELTKNQQQEQQHKIEQKGQGKGHQLSPQKHKEQEKKLAKQQHQQISQKPQQQSPQVITQWDCY